MRPKPRKALMPQLSVGARACDYKYRAPIFHNGATNRDNIEACPSIDESHLCSGGIFFVCVSECVVFTRSCANEIFEATRSSYSFNSAVHEL